MRQNFQYMSILRRAAPPRAPGDGSGEQAGQGTHGPHPLTTPDDGLLGERVEGTAVGSRDLVDTHRKGSKRR